MFFEGFYELVDGDEKPIFGISFFNDRSTAVRTIDRFIAVIAE